MEKKYNECDMIADLLPIYLDNATKEETNAFIEEHLVQCETCRKNCEWMKKSYIEVFEKKADGAYKIKKKNTKVLKKVKLKILLYAYVLILVLIWLYCNLDLVFML